MNLLIDPFFGNLVTLLIFNKLTKKFLVTFGNQTVFLVTLLIFNHLQH